jgi:phosphoribosylglycinamide formyltransferase-1
MLKIGVLASGGGSNLQALIDQSEAGSFSAQVVVVISNNSDAGALERARKHGIPAFHLSRATCGGDEALDTTFCDTLQAHGVQLVALAGYMRPIGSKLLAAYPNRVLNIHPALLPKYGGKGMYGIHVHEAVLAAGETTTGVTIHLVNHEYDRGAILAQRAVSVLPGDTPDILQQRVLTVEHELYAEVINDIASGSITLPDTA